MRETRLQLETAPTPLREVRLVDVAAVRSGIAAATALSASVARLLPRV